MSSRVLETGHPSTGSLLNRPHSVSSSFAPSNMNHMRKAASAAGASSSPTASIHMPTAQDYLPQVTASATTTTLYSTANAIWTEAELQLLQKSLADYPAEKYNNMARYIKIAAVLPQKCVRDVAFKVRSMTNGNGNGSTSSKRQEKSEENAREQVTKRLKTEQNQDQTANLFSTASASTTTSNNTNNNSNQPELDDAHITALLQDNMFAINTMRTNLLGGRLDDNKQQMMKFRDNCNAVLSSLGDLCNSIPPLPLKLDTSLITSLSHDNQDDL